MTAVLFSTVRNEAPFLLEWIAYHKAIGFERIVIFSNDCTDGTDEILNALATEGEVEHIPHTPSRDEKVAEQVSRIALERKVLSAGDWVIWLDADEFLNIHTGEGRVSDLVAAVGGARGMCISWRVFGDAGQKTFSGKFLDAPFTRCAAPGVLWKNVKTVFRMDNDVTELFQHKPVLAPEFWASGGSFLSSSGSRMSNDGKFMQLWRQGKKRGKIEEAAAGWDVAQINHYAVRTPDLFEFKKKRGRIGAPNSGQQRYDADYYDGLNRNEDEDRTILRWSAATKSEVEKLYSRTKGHIDLSDLLSKNYPGISWAMPGEAEAGPPPTNQGDPLSDTIYKKMHADHHQELEQRQYSNAKLARDVCTLLGPKSAIDVGCGIGLLISYFQKEGLDVHGLEGPWLEEDRMILTPDHYTKADLERPFDLGRRFDLCSSIEVAEHLEPDRADSFVSDLCALSDTVVFSAAIPGQGGKGHKNEQWHEYWCDKFEAQGYATHDPFRGNLRKDPNVLPWFQQNVLLFLKKGHPLENALKADRIPPSQANTILPTYHKKIVNRTRRRLKKKFANVGK